MIISRKLREGKQGTKAKLVKSKVKVTNQIAKSLYWDYEAGDDGMALDGAGNPFPPMKLYKLDKIGSDTIAFIYESEENADFDGPMPVQFYVDPLGYSYVIGGSTYEMDLSEVEFYPEMDLTWLSDNYQG